MTAMLRSVVRRFALILTATCLLGPLIAGVLVSSAPTAAFAQAPAADPAEANSFEEAKALGTVEAWTAFLSY